MDSHTRCDTLHVYAPARRNSPVRTHTASARVTGCALARNQASAGMFAARVCEVGGQAPLRVFMGASVDGGVLHLHRSGDHGIGRTGRRSARAPAPRAHCGALSALWCIPCERHYQVACLARLWLSTLLSPCVRECVSCTYIHACMCRVCACAASCSARASISPGRPSVIGPPPEARPWPACAACLSSIDMCHACMWGRGEARAAAGPALRGGTQ